MYKDFDAGLDAGFEGEHSSGDALTLQADGANVDLPDSSYIRDADMMRDGMDLVLDGPQGEITVEGYFSADPAPMLTADDGTTLSPQLVDSFIKSSPEYAQNMSMTDESPVGTVNEMSGEATVTHTDGSVETVQIGTPIYEGDIVETNSNGAVNITFSDDSSFAVSENARLAIDEYVFDPSTEAGSQNFSVLKGVFVFTSGLIGRDDPDDVGIDTPMGSIGIRGTIIAGDANDGEITVVEGAIVLRDFNGNEITLANQFDTATFKPGQGIEHNGQKAANDVADKFHSISKVAPSLFSSINDAAAEALDTEGVNEGPDVEEMLEGDAEKTDADGSVDENADGEVDGSVDDSATGESVSEGENTNLDGPKEGEPVVAMMGHDGLGGDDGGLKPPPGDSHNGPKQGLNLINAAKGDLANTTGEGGHEPPPPGHNEQVDPNILHTANISPENINIATLANTSSLGYGTPFTGSFKAADRGGHGEIYKGDVNDNKFTNYNTTTGDRYQNISVLTGEGNDTVVIDSAVGQSLQIGNVNLGAGNDSTLFRANVATTLNISKVDGEFGDDLIYFNMDGGSIVDVHEVHGGSGNDDIKFLFGGSGATLKTSLVLGNAGEDRFIFDLTGNSNYAPATIGNINGGTESDTLVFASNAASTIDFRGVGNIQSVGHIDLTNANSQTLKLSISQVLKMAEYDAASGAYRLVINTSGSDVIQIDTASGSDFDNGTAGTGPDAGYDIYEYTGPGEVGQLQVLIDSGSPALGEI